MGLNKFAFNRFISSSVSFLAAFAGGCFVGESLFMLFILFAASVVQGRDMPPKIDAESLKNRCMKQYYQYSVFLEIQVCIF